MRNPVFQINPAGRLEYERPIKPFKLSLCGEENRLPCIARIAVADAFLHRGTREAERARRLLLAGVRLRLLLFRGQRQRSYREAARWLSSGKAGSLLRSRRLHRSRCRP